MARGKRGKKFGGKKGQGAAKGAKRAEQQAKAKELDREALAAEEANPFHDPNRSTTGVLASKPTARDIKISSFSLTLHGSELIQDTTIELTIGRRYGLLGPNGSGKSTFLRALANRDVPIPKHVDIFLLHQEAHPMDVTALDYVVNAVKEEIARLEHLQEELMEEDEMDEEALEDVMERLSALNPDTLEMEAGRILHGLGFSPAMMRRPTKAMSGGWRMRVALARALFVKPTLLLLDEPTNHLDLESCVWLEEYLRHKFNRCLVVVSHSQDFLNGVCTNVVHINHKRQLEVYSGNYDQYVKTKQELEVNQQKRYEKEQADIKHIKDFIASCGTYSNLVKQAKSKQKIIDKMVAAGLTEPVHVPQRPSFKFPETEKLPPPVLCFTDVHFSYSGKLEDALYKDVELGVDCDSRVALVGPNGVGKSTLLKLMIGELTPTEGNVSRHTHLNIARYHQHSAEALDPESTPLGFMRAKYEHLNMEEDKWRQVIGRFGITGVQQTTPISKLSDGQKSRLVFACIATERPNMLLLDEPTNHLDIESIDALADAINHFTGGLVLVSHDFRLIDQVAREIWVCENKGVYKWDGDIRAYKDHLRASWDDDVAPTSI